MLLTAEEASKLWCPSAIAGGRIIPNDGPALGVMFNRHMDGSPAEPCMCIHVRCMAWKWMDKSIPGIERKGKCRIYGDK